MVEVDGKVKLTTTLVPSASNTFLVLYIVPDEDGYTVFDYGAMIEEWGYRTFSDLEAFLRKNPYGTGGIRHNDVFFFCDYPKNLNVQMAINDFVRFFCRV